MVPYGISKQSVRLRVLSLLGRYRYSIFHDVLAHLQFPRDSELDQLFGIKELEARLIKEVDGIHVGSSPDLVFNTYKEDYFERIGPLVDYREIYFPKADVQVVIHGEVLSINKGMGEPGWFDNKKMTEKKRAGQRR